MENEINQPAAIVLSEVKIGEYSYGCQNLYSEYKNNAGVTCKMKLGTIEHNKGFVLNHNFEVFGFNNREKLGHFPTIEAAIATLNIIRTAIIKRMQA
jgi:hypothetical protein